MCRCRIAQGSTWNRVEGFLARYAPFVRLLERVSATRFVTGRGIDDELAVWDRPPDSKKGSFLVCVRGRKRCAKRHICVIILTSSKA